MRKLVRRRKVFDHLIDRGAYDDFAQEDFLALRRLSVSVLHAARTALRGDVSAAMRRLLGAIPVDLDIWGVHPRIMWRTRATEPAW